MPRKLLSGVVLAAVLASGAAAQQPQELVPGVTFDRQVQFTPRGAVAIDVLTMPKPGGLYELRPALSNGAVQSLEPLTALQRAYSVAATVAGVSADPFDPGSGTPEGVLLRSGVLDHPPRAQRSSVAIAGDGTLRVERASFTGYWQGTGQRRTFTGLNDPPRGAASVGIPDAQLYTLYTPAWGPRTPKAPGVAEVVIRPLTPTVPNTELRGPVISIGSGGNTAIPPDGAVLTGRLTQAAKLAAGAPVGTTVTIRLTLDPDWRGVPDAIGGGPVLVRNGVPIFRANELFEPEDLVPREARSAVGQLADGRIVLVAVERNDDGTSIGMTNYELAQTLVRLGAVTGSALGSGDWTSMAFDGALLGAPRPATDAGPPISDALLVLYSGVYAPPAAEAVLSPNGDGVGEEQRLAYKVVRPSTVTATLTGPDGGVRLSESAQKQPGLYPVTWTGRKADGAIEPEGLWRWTVSAVDDRGRSSRIERTFALDTTLGALELSAPAPPLTATFQLTRQARVTATVERGGAIVRTLAGGTLLPGAQQVAWDGRTDDGSPASAGDYVVRVAAESPVGRVELVRPLAIRRAAAR